MENKRKQKNLNEAHKHKRDEFYIDLPAIEYELAHFKESFRDKTVFCNCDNPFESQFVRYFLTHETGIKKLYAMSYAPYKCYRQMSLLDDDVKADPRYSKHAYIAEFSGDDIREGFTNYKLFVDTHTLVLHNTDGSFKSRESEEYLDDSDIVVTGPPFSLFRDFIDMMMKHGKKFLVVGTQNAISCKDIFGYFQDNRMWFGFPFKNDDAYFRVPDEACNLLYAKGVYNEDKGEVHFRNCHWYTNLEEGRQNNHIELVKTFRGNETKYPFYDGYPAIEVSKVADIPKDFTGLMGVPITFMKSYDPEQFIIHGLDRYVAPKCALKDSRLSINGHTKYARVIISNKEYA